MNKCLKGIVCANITPFDKNGNVDYESLKRLTVYLAESGINAAYPSGTNGEGLALTIEERKKIARTMVEAINGKIHIAIQCGTQTFEGTRELVQNAKDVGADAAGVITPFFFNQSQDAIIEYYSSLFESVENFPIYIYNIPSHTNNDILPSSMAKLASKYENLAGVKYSHPDIIRLTEYIAIKPEGFDALIGCDRLIYPAAKVGAAGTISGPAAVFPELFTNLWKAVTEKNDNKALKLQRTICENDNMLAKYQSIPLLKLYLKRIGIINETVCRIPFREVSEAEENEIVKVVNELRAKI
jgi:dihydrodipicolinate synthase/N-acetylneuraminate lyase